MCDESIFEKSKQVNNKRIPATIKLINDELEFIAKKMYPMRMRRIKLIVRKIKLKKLLKEEEKLKRMLKNKNKKKRD